MSARRAETVSARPPEPAPVRTWLRSALFDNLGLKFVSLVLACTVFILVNTGQDREIVARVGMSYTLPDDKVLVSERVDEIRVTVRGPWRLIRHFDEREVDRVNLDLTRTPGGEVAITADMIHLPEGLTITSISPRVVRVAFERRAQKAVPIQPTFVGRPLHGFHLDEAETRRDLGSAIARGPEGAIAALTGLRTEEIRIDGRSEPFSQEVAVIPPDGVEASPATVTVQVAIDEVLVSRRLSPVAITVTGVDPSRVRVEPAEVDVVLTGGQRGVERAIAAKVRATIAVAASEPGRHSVPVLVEDLPSGVGVQVIPPQVTVVPRR
jgi:YbbR domain-containing protein